MWAAVSSESGSSSPESITASSVARRRRSSAAALDQASPELSAASNAGRGHSLTSAKPDRATGYQAGDVASQPAAGHVQRGTVNKEGSIAQPTAGLPTQGSAGGMAAHVVTAVEGRPVHPLTIAIQALLADASSRSEMERPGSADSSRRSSSPSPTKQTLQGSSAVHGGQGEHPEPAAHAAGQGQHGAGSVQGVTGGEGRAAFAGEAQSGGGGGGEASLATQAAAGGALGSAQVLAGTARTGGSSRPASPRGAGAEVGLGCVDRREREPGSPRSPRSSLTAERLRRQLSCGSSQAAGGAAREVVEAPQPASRTVGFAAPARALELRQPGAADAVPQAQVGLWAGAAACISRAPELADSDLSQGSTSDCLDSS